VTAFNDDYRWQQASPMKPTRTALHCPGVRVICDLLSNALKRSQIRRES
jgi:hypothetical protein